MLAAKGQSCHPILFITGKTLFINKVGPCVAALISTVTCKTLDMLQKSNFYHILSQINNIVKKVLILIAITYVHKKTNLVFPSCTIP